MSANSFGFGDAVREVTDFDLPVVPKRVNHQQREEGRAVAAEAGFHRRSPVKRTSATAQVPQKAVGRVRLNEAAPRRHVRFQGEARVQLNMQAPLPVAEAWRELMEAAPVGQWELLEAAVPLLRKHFGLSDDR